MAANNNFVQEPAQYSQKAKRSHGKIKVLNAMPTQNDYCENFLTQELRRDIEKHKREIKDLKER